MFNKHKKAMRNAKFKKLITRTIGHVHVDTVLTEEQVTPGDTLIGEVRISSKKGFKEIEKVSVSLMQQSISSLSPKQNSRIQRTSKRS